MSYKRSHHERDPLPDTPRNIRLDAGLKTRHIAALTGRPISVIGRLETQRSNPQAFTLALFYAACGRADLATMLSHVLDDDKQDDVLIVYERWEARYGPSTEFGRVLAMLKAAEKNGWTESVARLRRKLDRLGRTHAVSTE
jgi:transcriptional regulator with XRE-family HTH domain